MKMKIKIHGKWEDNWGLGKMEQRDRSVDIGCKWITMVNYGKFERLSIKSSNMEDQSNGNIQRWMELDYNVVIWSHRLMDFKE